MDKANKNSDTEVQKWQLIDSWLRGCLREGRRPGIEDFKHLAGQTEITPDEIEARSETVCSDFSHEFNLQNQHEFDKIKLAFQEKKWRSNQIFGPIEDCAGKQIPFDDIYIILKKNGYKISKEDLRSLLASSYIPSYHPAKDYFEKLEKRKDFDPNIDFFKKLSEYIITDDLEFFSVMLEKHFIRGIDQLFRGVPNRYLFCLIGDQLAGKSQFIQWLNPLPPRYYSERPLRAEKDAEILLSQVWVYSVEELEGMSRHDLNKTKSYISRALINERKPYASEASTLPRLANFYASTNDNEFLTDVVNTRWLIFEIENINFNYNNLQTGKKNIDVNSLWWQALRAWQSNNSAGMLTVDETKKQAQYNLKFHVNTIEYDLIIRHLRKPDPDDKPEFLTATELMNRLAAKVPSTLRFNPVSFGREMKRAGYVSEVKWIINKAARGYLVVYSDEPIKFDDDEILPF